MYDGTIMNTALSASKHSTCTCIGRHCMRLCITVWGGYWLENLLTLHYPIATHWGVAYIIVTTLWRILEILDTKQQRKSSFIACRAQNILLLLLSLLGLI